MPTYLVLENPRSWSLEVPRAEVVAARDYLTQARFSESRRARVFNLCRTYGYQTLGYWVSLLAEARGHRPLPSVATLQDMRASPLARFASQDLDELMQRCLGSGERGTHELRVYFGGSHEAGMQRLARALYAHFPAPLLQVDFSFASGRWHLDNVRPVASSEIPEEERGFVAERAARHFQRGGGGPAAVPSARFDLAILHDPGEVDAPSSEAAIRNFVKAAHDLGMAAEPVGREDYGSIAEYDALFIRETTAVDHHTYRFARRAEQEGLVVIDAPEAILRCTNKVYQAEIFARNGIPAPATRVLHRDNVDDVVAALGFPLVLKRPDSSFSQGVSKAEDRAGLDAFLAELFSRSALVVAQEYVPSEFDWRIGVLDGVSLFAAKYHMAPGHWQIQRTGSGAWRRFGKVEAMPLEDVPPGAIEVAVRAAGLIGDGLFGVDVKQTAGERFLVMEVNDNPNIDAGYEDAVLGEELYLAVMRWFLTRLERRGLASS